MEAHMEVSDTRIRYLWWCQHWTCVDEPSGTTASEISEELVAWWDSVRLYASLHVFNS